MAGGKQDNDVRERRRDRAVEKMNDALRAEYIELGGALARADVNEVKNRYEVGVIVQRVSDAGKYGTSAVKLLAVALGQDKDSLYDAARVVTCWTPKQLEAVLARPTQHRRPLSFSHLAVLATVTNTTKREEYLAACLKLGLSVRDLERLVVGRKSRTRGRHPTRQVQTMIAQTKTTMKWLAELEPRVAANRETRKLLEEAAAEARLLVSRLEDALNQGQTKAPSSIGNDAEEQDKSEIVGTSRKSPSALWGGGSDPAAR